MRYRELSNQLEFSNYDKTPGLYRPVKSVFLPHQKNNNMEPNVWEPWTLQLMPGIGLQLCPTKAPGTFGAYSGGRVGSLNEGGCQDPRAFCSLVSIRVNPNLALPVRVPSTLLRGPTVWAQHYGSSKSRCLRSFGSLLIDKIHPRPTKSS